MDLTSGKGLRIHDAATAILVGQVFWGALFCLPLGFSFTALRISTLILGWVGLVATYALARFAGAERWAATLGALTLSLNPLYLGLASTFMTDVPFTAIAAASALFLAVAIRSGSRPSLLVGCALAAWATLIRQLGLALLFAFAVATAVRHGARGQVAFRMLPALGGALLLAGASAALRAGAGEPLLNYGVLAILLGELSRPAPQVLWIVGVSVVSALLYLGLFLLPVLLLPDAESRVSRSCRRVVRVGSLLLVALIAARMTWRNRLMPVSANILDETGLGPLTLPDVLTLGLPNAPTAPPWLPWLLSAASLLGAALLSERIGLGAVHAWRRRTRSASFATAWFPAFLVSTSLLLTLLFFLRDYFDRYLLPVVPLALGLLARGRAPNIRSWRVAASLVSLAGLGVLSITATHDYLAWNRVRWEIVADATGRLGIPAEDLAGGYEVDGWVWYDSTVRAAGIGHFSQPREYMITFGPVPGFDVIRRYPYQRWLPRGEAALLLLRSSP